MLTIINPYGFLMTCAAPGPKEILWCFRDYAQMPVGNLGERTRVMCLVVSRNEKAPGSYIMANVMIMAEKGKSWFSMVSSE